MIESFLLGNLKLLTLKELLWKDTITHPDFSSPFAKEKIDPKFVREYVAFPNSFELCRQNLEIWRSRRVSLPTVSIYGELITSRSIAAQRKCHEFACACKKRVREPRYTYILCGRLSNEALIANIDRAAFATCTWTTEVSEGLADSCDRISGGPGARHENEWLPYVTRRKPKYEISRLCTQRKVVT